MKKSKKILMYLYDNGRPVKGHMDYPEFFQMANDRFKETGYSEWKPRPVISYSKHTAKLRSICETLGINPGEFHCTCGRPVSDTSVHFTVKEWDEMTAEEKFFSP